MGPQCSVKQTAQLSKMLKQSVYGVKIKTTVHYAVQSYEAKRRKKSQMLSKKFKNE